MENRTLNFQILSLDGGGIKGLFSAAVLAHLQDDLNVKIVDHFDLITGTSTGGLIAIALSIGMSPKEIVRFYVDNGTKIFTKSKASGIKKFFGSKYNSEGLEASIKECFENKKLFHCKKRLVIPSYNIGEDDVYLFKTPHHERLTRDWKVPLWKVAMATTAAPTYFPAFQGVDHMRLVDGGVWANNPTMVGIIEARSMLNIPTESIKVFNLGTTDEIKGRPKVLDNGGKWHWREEGVEVIMRGQSIGAYTQALHLLGKENILRVDPAVPYGLFELDKLSEPELLAKAAHVSRHSAPKFKEIFINHTASKFNPIYKEEEPKQHG